MGVAIGIYRKYIALDGGCLVFHEKLLCLIGKLVGATGCLTTVDLEIGVAACRDNRCAKLHIHRHSAARTVCQNNITHLVHLGAVHSYRRGIAVDFTTEHTLLTSLGSKLQSAIVLRTFTAHLNDIAYFIRIGGKCFSIINEQASGSVGKYITLRTDGCNRTVEGV